VTGVFAADLTLAELRQLRAKQRWEFRDTSHDWQYGVVTFDEFLDAALSVSVGVYPGACVVFLRACRSNSSSLLTSASDGCG
jgi:hypothetical protein